MLVRHHHEYELYAVDDNSDIKNRLFLYVADNENHARLLIKPLRLWLTIINTQQRADCRKKNALLPE
ncbi:hypothetical protein C5L22_05840 [Pantoea ananatis]|uniref:Uncharacterized protein n=1 Tax=Pantoea eucalypti TaxID=470933 RepID=A0ABY2ZNE9_9GAMM|nr:hypothetical protein B9D02_10725 [Pantoea vagans]PQL30163.1 hypothetical protein C5L22_05840 [Pantoea ananatis]TPD96221.1 hypothetical protein FJP68_05650 [Pantoea vagans]TPV41759.1 hypothetical protein FJW02_03565 [Pantoea eucalypti]